MTMHSHVPTDRAISTEGLSRTAAFVGRILSIVAHVVGGIIITAGAFYLLFGLAAGGIEIFYGMAAGLVAAIWAAIVWAQLMLLALVARYISVRTAEATR